MDSIEQLRTIHISYTHYSNGYLERSLQIRRLLMMILFVLALKQSQQPQLQATMSQASAHAVPTSRLDTRSCNITTQLISTQCRPRNSRLKHPSIDSPKQNPNIRPCTCSYKLSYLLLRIIRATKAQPKTRKSSPTFPALHKLSRNALNIPYPISQNPTNSPPINTSCL